MPTTGKMVSKGVGVLGAKVPGRKKEQERAMVKIFLKRGCGYLFGVKI